MAEEQRMVEGKLLQISCSTAQDGVWSPPNSILDGERVYLARYSLVSDRIRYQVSVPGAIFSRM